MGRGLEVLYMKSSTWRRIQDTRVRAIQADDIEVLDAEIHVGMDVVFEEISFRREVAVSVSGDCSAQCKIEMKIFKFSCGATLQYKIAVAMGEGVYGMVSGTFDPFALALLASIKYSLI